MIKLLDILNEENKILVPRRSPEERQKNYLIATQKKIQQYIKDGSHGDLDLSNTPITSLPDNLTKVGGNLYLGNTKITSLPNNLTEVEGHLDLANAPIISLPDGLKVVRSLDLENTPIEKLPDNLTVKYYLYLDNSDIDHIPKNLKVGWDLILRYTPLSKKYSSKRIKQMIEDKGGSIGRKVYIV